ncbi:histidinol-phosphatase [Paenibacillus protaetiae]|uniref:Histidinol-phosphatase n=1 Tax=Paenibacillus protaetiae TaxID=2509456 RepID=A0A4P6EYQ7_9BACL|nr:histidinol-phosphatase [Paenibacillus protaetiae]QAY68252.1 histidinol-phosphatase HisJ family protein [Paenibacillus protaetiae]
MKFDLHTHHERCGHADGMIEAYIQSAIQGGLQAIGISDHSPYFGSEEDQPFPNIAMAKSAFPGYIEEVLRLKEKYSGQIEVLLGVESDFFPDYADVYRNYYANIPFDYIIGSVHHVGGISIFNKKRFTKLNDEQKFEAKRDYYDLIRQSALSGMFDVMAHIDAMKAYYPPFSDIPAHQEIDATLRTIAECGVSVEINTSGKMKDVGGWYPSDDILERACHFGVNVTFGSDAHTPTRVGDDWELVRTRLKEIGFKQWVFYRSRRPVIVPL